MNTASKDSPSADWSALALSNSGPSARRDRHRAGRVLVVALDALGATFAARLLLCDLVTHQMPFPDAGFLA